jgi:hypothetical protein
MNFQLHSTATCLIKWRSSLGRKASCYIYIFKFYIYISTKVNGPCSQEYYFLPSISVCSYTDEADEIRHSLNICLSCNTRLSHFHFVIESVKNHSVSIHPHKHARTKKKHLKRATSIIKTPLVVSVILNNDSDSTSI